MIDGAAEILVVDDEESNLKVLRRLLEKAGYALSLAASGPEALDTLRKQQPELLLTDLKMPGLDGLGLAGGTALDGRTGLDGLGQMAAKVGLFPLDYLGL